MLDKIVKSIREKRLIAPRSLVILGLSGGGDSVCLFHALRRLQKEETFFLLAIHVNHQIRGEEADADEAFVRSLCEEYKVPLEIVREDVKALAKAQGASLEEAGRNLRYEVFHRLAQERLVGDASLTDVRIALAHHANDQEETVFMNFLRGAGVRGISGMREIRRADVEFEKPVYYIRPLLSYTHEQLLSTLREQELPWCEDGTNQEKDCVRNILRLDLLPQIKKELSPAFTEHCEKMSGLFAEIEDYLCEQAEMFLQGHGRREKEGYSVEAGALSRVHAALRRYVIRQCVICAGGKRTDLSAGHVRQVLELLSMQSGREICLPGGMRVSRSFDCLIFRSADADVAGEELPYRLSVSVWDGNGAEFVQNLEKYRRQLYTKWFDCDKIQAKYPDEPPVLRLPKEGDYLVIHESGQKKSLQRYLQQEKIPVYQRSSIPVVAVGSEILWVIGYRTGEEFHVTEQTGRVLRIAVEPRTEGFGQ